MGLSLSFSLRERERTFNFFKNFDHFSSNKYILAIIIFSVDKIKKTSMIMIISDDDDDDMVTQ